MCTNERREETAIVSRMCTNIQNDHSFADMRAEEAMLRLLEEVLRTTVELRVCLLYLSAMAQWFQEGSTCDEMAYTVDHLSEHVLVFKRASRQRK